MQSSPIAYATQLGKSTDELDTFSFYDSEGNLNTIAGTVVKSGEVIVEHYINGSLLNTSHAVTLDGYNVTVETTASNGTVDTVQIEMSGGIFFENADAVSRASNSYSYAGQAVFLGHQEGYAGGSYTTHKLNFYESCNGPTYQYRTLNILAGGAVSASISLVMSVIALLAPPIAGITKVASELVYALISAVGSTVIGGIVQSAVSGRYYVKTWYYTIRATDPDTGNTCTFTGNEYQVLLETGTYSSTVYLEGWRAWWTGTVLSSLWSQIFTCTYPGVSRVTRI